MIIGNCDTEMTFWTKNAVLPQCVKKSAMDDWDGPVFDPSKFQEALFQFNPPQALHASPFTMTVRIAFQRCNFFFTLQKDPFFKVLGSIPPNC